jgi:hypothetical protein
MKVLDTIHVRGDRRIDLCQGDLTDLARNEWFDAIVVRGRESATSTSS